MSEPFITINGRRLIEAQAMAVRVAVDAYASILHAEGLGDDEHGRRMTRLYLARLGEVERLMHKPS